MKVLICTFGNPFHYACRIFYSLLSNVAEVKLVFLNSKWNKDTENFITEYIKSDRPDLIAISLLTFELDLCKKLIANVRSHCSKQDTKIIFGGPHAYLAPEACLDAADFVCTGEGEYTLLRLCEEYNEVGRWDRVTLGHIPNLLYRDNGVTKQSDVQDFYYSRPFIDKLPFPAYGEPGIHIYDGIAWQGDIGTQSNFYYAFSSRGCPYRCSYCINAVYKSCKVTYRSPQKVIEELMVIKKKFPNLKRIHFVDEVFCWQRKWVEEFVHFYKEHISLPFECESFPGRHSEEVIRILANVGLKKVHIGVQSCSQRILDEIFVRPQKIQDILHDNKTYIAQGILPTYDFIVDNPFEKSTELLETVNIARQLERPNFFRIYSLFFFPYHPLTLRAERDGLYNSNHSIQSYYNKITTTHSGDQYSEKSWYVRPLKSILNGDEKVALNWLLTCYGDSAIPKRIVDYAFNKYRDGKLYCVVALAYYYRFLDKVYKIKERLSAYYSIYHQHGFFKLFQYVYRRLSIKIVNKTRTKIVKASLTT